MLLNIRHETVYRYTQPARYSIQHLRLTPREEATQRAIAWEIHTPGRRRQLTDAYGNIAHLLTLDEPHDEISIVVDGQVETVEQGGYLIHDAGALPPLAYLSETPLTRVDDGIRELAARHLKRGIQPLRALLDLLPVIRERTGGAASPAAEEALSQGNVVCVDQAHLFIACCRAAGIPARYVSGYVWTPEWESVASHAWADAWLGELGWVSLDIERHSLTGAEHCRLAVGRDFLDACPVRSVRRGGGEEAIMVSVQGAQQQ